MSMAENVYTLHCIEIKQMLFKINMVVDMESLLSQMVKCSVAQAHCSTLYTSQPVCVEKWKL